MDNYIYMYSLVKECYCSKKRYVSIYNKVYVPLDVNVLIKNNILELQYFIYKGQYHIRHRLICPKCNSNIFLIDM